MIEVCCLLLQTVQSQNVSELSSISCTTVKSLYQIKIFPSPQCEQSLEQNLALSLSSKSAATGTNGCAWSASI